MTPLFSVHNLHYVYPDGTPALRGVTLDLHPGEAVALVGGNGAGKSTLLLHLSGCLLPPPGSLFLNGTAFDPAAPAGLDSLRRTVGMVFQDPDDQLFMATVRDDVAFGPLNMGLSPAEVEARVDAALRTVGCTHLADRPPYRLSGGEKRLVALATVLSMAPPALILDEPTSNLDPRARRDFIELMRSLAHTRLMATHDLEMALELCPRTIVLGGGEVLADGPTRQIFTDDALLERARLERPSSMR